MPLISGSAYRPPIWLRHGDLQTVYPVLFRPGPRTAPRRERIETPDGDFLDLDWHAPAAEGTSKPRLAVIGHGLEGHSGRKYVAGMAAALARRGWEALAWNQRGCSGEPNRSIAFYHSGFTEDLATVLAHACAARPDAAIALVGFSIGGNIVLKYLGEDPGRVPACVAAAAAISVPCDLAGASGELERPRNRLYEHYFLRSLRAKIRTKHARVGDALDIAGLDAIPSLRAFDDRYTAPMFGFGDAAAYYRKASCLRFLEAVRVPSLMISAADDPFLSDACYPRAAAAANPNLFLEMPPCGGHVGFVALGPENEYWSETRAAAFLDGTV